MDLTGQLLIATPQMADSRFANAVIVICRHDASSTMGLIINKKAKSGLTLQELVEQLKLGEPQVAGDTPIYQGGPVEVTRGMVLHSSDHLLTDSVMLGNEVAMTANIRIISEIINGGGPAEYIITLGHASWAEGQLENELKSNSWLTMPYVHDLVFHCLNRNQWQDCYTHLGIATEHMPASVGHA